jgi:hypothetical protein
MPVRCAAHSIEGAKHSCHCSVPKKYKRRTEVNWVGTLAYIFFYCAFVFYLWIRITKTLDLGLYVGEHCMCLTALARYIKGCDGITSQVS